MQGDENRPVPLRSLEESTAQNLGIQVFYRGAEKEITEARPPWTIAMRGTRGGDIDGFPLLRIVATKYLFRIDAKVFA